MKGRVSSDIDKMSQFGTLFSYSWTETVFAAATYYEAELLRDFGDFKAGTKFDRINMCIETGVLEFIDSAKTTLCEIPL